MRRLLLPILLVAAGVAACEPIPNESGTSPGALTEPERQAATSFSNDAPEFGRAYPLAVGMEWTYAVRYRQRTRADVESEFGPWREQHLSRLNRCESVYADRGQKYFSISERTRELELPYREFVGLSQGLRQDAAGLYSAGRSGGLAAFPAPEYAAEHVRMPAPGLAPFEWLVLQYPLHVGQVWSSRSATGAKAEVEAIEPIRTPFDVEPAARVRRTASLGPVLWSPELSWYGRSGLLRTSQHIDSAWTDIQGNRIGDRQQELELNLVSFRQPWSSNREPGPPDPGKPELELPGVPDVRFPLGSHERSSP